MARSKTIHPKTKKVIQKIKAHSKLTKKNHEVQYKVSPDQFPEHR